MFAGIFAVSKDVKISRRASPVAVGDSLIPRLGPGVASHNEEVGEEMAIYFISRVKSEVVEMCVLVLCAAADQGRAGQSSQLKAAHTWQHFRPGSNKSSLPVSHSSEQPDPSSRIH